MSPIFETVRSVARIFLTIAFLTLCLGACVVHPRVATGRAVVVRKGHTHHRGCGHYRHRGRWYVLEGHSHGPRCGHHFVRGVWILK